MKVKLLDILVYTSNISSVRRITTKSSSLLVEPIPFNLLILPQFNRK